MKVNYNNHCKITLFRYFITYIIFNIVGFMLKIIYKENLQKSLYPISKRSLNNHINQIVCQVCISDQHNVHK